MYDLSSVVTQSTAPQQIVDHIVSAISAGALSPGEALPAERELADSLGVSRTSVRSALETLAGQGWVVRKRGRGGGTFVSPNPPDLEGVIERVSEFQGAQHDMLEARAIIHGSIAGLAAAKVTDEQVAELWELHKVYVQVKDPQESRRADYAFHEAVAQASGNDVLVQVVRYLDMNINVGFRHDPYSAQLHDQAARDHAGIIRALADRDPAAASQRCEYHFRATTM